MLVPALTPVTTPDTTVATPPALLVHVPPLVVEARVVVDPTHTDAVPVIAAGGAFTVTVVDVVQPPSVYVINTVPALTPVTTPVPPSTVALDRLLLLHAPPASP